jgi:hypothetical protein
MSPFTITHVSANVGDGLNATLGDLSQNTDLDEVIIMTSPDLRSPLPNSWISPSPERE